MKIIVIDDYKKKDDSAQANVKPCSGEGPDVESHIPAEDKVSFIEAKSMAVRYISLMLRCSSDVAGKLRRAGFDGEVIDEVIEELSGMGYINDVLYIQKFLHDRNKLNPKSKKALRYELLRKGLKPEIIDAAMSEWEPNESDVAFYIVSRKFGNQKMDDERKRKISAYLQRRGYDSDIIEEVLNRMGEKEGHQV